MFSSVLCIKLTNVGHFVLSFYVTAAIMFFQLKAIKLGEVASISFLG